MGMGSIFTGNRDYEELLNDCQKVEYPDIDACHFPYTKFIIR